MALGTLTMVMFCLLTALPHLLYGPGEDALQLTEEYGSSHDADATFLVMGKRWFGG